MDLTTEAEDVVIDPKLLAQLENLESQCNPDFDLGFVEWLYSYPEYANAQGAAQ